MGSAHAFLGLISAAGVLGLVLLIIGYKVRGKSGPE
jgi:hypothetical protein